MVSSKNITFTNVVEHWSDGTVKDKYPIAVRAYRFVKDHGEDHLYIPQLTRTYYFNDSYVPFGQVK